MVVGGGGGGGWNQRGFRGWGRCDWVLPAPCCVPEDVFMGPRQPVRNGVERWDVNTPGSSMHYSVRTHRELCSVRTPNYYGFALCTLGIIYK